MFLTRRNFLAWILLALAALGWLYGHALQAKLPEAPISDATMMPTKPLPEVTESSALGHTEPAIPESPNPDSATATDRQQKFANGLGYVFCFAALCFAVVGIFFLSQQAPALGPDGAFLLLSATAWLYQLLLWQGLPFLISGALLFAAFFCIRELWGWLLLRFRLDWCALYRLARRCRTLHMAMFLLTGICFLFLAQTLTLIWFLSHWSVSICSVAAWLLQLSCLIRFGLELRHFQKQLENFHRGTPIIPTPGLLLSAEQQLLQLQTQHAEAVHNAVASERFRVDLIANVSHDLRTPLTAILGYGELLQQETLSDTGNTHLQQLNRKAGYMRDLVESLFELTKVSSGVAESKLESIDLIRLLEQTIGLLDDRLSAAGLQLRRHYEAETLPVVTDGTRMHQVFANLLGNAIKYALPGTRIRLDVTTEENTCRVRVVNTASYEMDFTPEQILQRFARGDKARSTQGSGLGLAIAQTYTESVSGDFQIRIDGDQFSAIVTLPL